MNVDANVIIFERIREELRLGKTAINAIKSGYETAFVTIMDSNLTTLITAFILLWKGTGPIRGFAVTMILGIVASLFTALFVSKVLMDLIFQKNKNALSI
jgi:preprotein translocase subunit SecD